jgi:hypothetical protein
MKPHLDAFVVETLDDDVTVVVHCLCGLHHLLVRILVVVVLFILVCEGGCPKLAIYEFYVQSTLTYIPLLSISNLRSAIPVGYYDSQIWPWPYLRVYIIYFGSHAKCVRFDIFSHPIQIKMISFER